ncbi:zinc transporter ZntB [Aestuariirhabdus litorea]|uniref:Zinc transporter ZntB n=1 Tax=Aestuariirhabdus litorea TaxID=2528527 RepID=A0A3P3VPG0_9GAMM|nr:zinc transporter ZntB [Aestuariirhabdus litorea]RRJ83808.1 zinc transporter ZntB [Aestuariirhabdus litorea]RWW97031.1 zinc transporter ZntB [Endozoicomonadaceae bacterium GTF-13]
MSNPAGLVYGHFLDPALKGTACSWESLANGLPAEAVWLHFDYTDSDTQHWIRELSGLDPIAADSLLSEETRPRASSIHGGLLLALRGVNLNPDSNPEDMVSLRLWSDGHHVISTRKRRLLSAADLSHSIASGEGPYNAGELVTEFASRLIIRMQHSIDSINDKLDELEMALAIGDTPPQRGEVASLRQQAISIRRYLSPQREAMTQLQSDKITWISPDCRLRLRETTDVLIRYIEDLDSVRDRAAVAHEELNNRITEHMNNRMYVLSIVAAIFLPLGFLTGLLGINVGGIPGADNPYSFIAFCLFLTIIVGLQVWLFKKKGWF